MNSEIDKYINPKKSVFAGSVIFIVIICGFFTWASLAELSSAVIIPGVIEAYGKKKIVQSLQGGMINQILVKNGDQVNKGDLLVQLDSTIDDSDRIVAEKEYVTYSVSAARAIAELTNEPDFSHPVLENKIMSASFLENTMGVEKFFFDTRRSELNSSVDVVKKRLKRLKEMHFGLNEELKTYRIRKKLVDEELKAMNALYQNGHVSRTKILSLKREQADVEGTVVSLISRKKQTKWEVSELEQQVVTLNETYRREAAAHLKEAEAGKLKAYERIKSTQFLTKAQKLTAPISGIVVNFEVSTLSAIIRLGDKIMEIVPIQQPMIISGKINPQDIDQILVGQTVRVRFSSFSQSTTPEFLGKVTYVAADLTYDKNGEFAYYKTEILVKEENLSAFDLQPGMPAETFITIGTRSPLNYLLKPLFDNLEKAWKEPN